MIKIIGITGGIGSGKSTFTEYLEREGYPIHDSDKAVSSIYTNPNNNFINLIEKLGLKKAINRRKINKKIIAESIFKDRIIKRKLEKYIHKEVRTFRKNFIQNNRKKKNKIIFIDVPLLLENNLDKEFNIIISIISTKKNREERVLKKNKFSKNTLNKVFEAQTTDSQRRLRSDIIIYNNKTKKDFIVGARKLLKGLLK